MRLARTKVRVYLILTVVLCSYCIWPAYGSPFSDLSSPSQDVRAHAAEIIQSDHLYKATPRKQWDKLAAELKEGMSTLELSNFLKRNGLLISDSFPLNRKATYSFRLDDSWVLMCEIMMHHDDLSYYLMDYKIVEEPKMVIVSPPINYTGIWKIYRINGEKVEPSYYHNGLPQVIF